MKLGKWSFWRIMFYLDTFIVVAESVTFVSLYLLTLGLPTATVSLNAQYISLILLGGVSKEFFSGFFMAYSYHKWNEEKKKV